MASNLTHTTLRILSIPLILFVLLLPFGLITGWNGFTLIIYWFLITPFVVEYMPRIFAKGEGRLNDSLMGMLIFYSFMVLMIYQHYKTDMFAIMIISGVINIGLVWLISYVKKVYREDRVKRQHPFHHSGVKL